MREPPIQLLLGVPFHPVTMDEAIAACQQVIKLRKPKYFATANVDFIAQAYHDDDLRNILFYAHRVVCDGMPLVWFAKFVKATIPERVAGSDMVFELFQLANLHTYKIFFLGSDAETLTKAQELISQRYPHAKIVGHYSPPYAPLHEWDNEEIVAQIKDAQPDMLMVAVGCPKQERWIYEHHEATGVPLSIGIGASLDFIAGKQTRCPKWMQTAGLEWFWRMVSDPKRLVKRYVRDCYFLLKLGFLQWKLTRSKRIMRFTEKDEQARVAFRSKRAMVLEWRGTIDSTSGQEAAPVIPKPKKPILIDTSQVKFMDSSGLGRLVTQARYCRDARIPFGLLEPSRFVRKLLDGLRMTAQLPVYASVSSFHEQTRAPFTANATNGTIHETIVAKGIIDRNSISKIEVFFSKLLDQFPEGGSIRIDFTEVRFLDSYGIGRLCHMKKLATAKGVEFWLINVSGTADKVLTMVCLKSLLVKQSESEATRA